MKKIIMILSLVAIGLTACKKEDIKPNGNNNNNNQTGVDCNCGIVVMSTPISSVRNELRIRNNCSNNIKYASEVDLTIGPGDEVCSDSAW